MGIVIQTNKTYRVIKVGHVDISMLQERDKHQVIVGNHVGHQVVSSHEGKTKGVNAKAQEGKCHQECNIRLHNLPVLLSCEHHCAGWEVVSILAP